MRGPLAAALFLALAVAGSSAQDTVVKAESCTENCWEDAINYFLGFGNQAMKDVAEYLLYLRYVRTNFGGGSKGTAFAYDLTRRFSWQHVLQRNLAASATIMLPSSNTCNPFFYAGYTQGYYTHVTSTGPWQWQCDETCDAATDLLSITDVFDEAPYPANLDLLDHACDLLKFYSKESPTLFCQPTNYSDNEMLLAFYNSNDQYMPPTGDCSVFWPRIETIIDCPTCGTGFYKKHFNADHVFAARYMRYWLMRSCCRGYKNPWQWAVKGDKNIKTTWGVHLKSGSRFVTRDEKTFRELVAEHATRNQMDFDHVSREDAAETERLDSAAREEFEEFENNIKRASQSRS